MTAYTMKKVVDTIMLNKKSKLQVLTEYDIQKGFTVACNINATINSIFDFNNAKSSDACWVNDSKFSCSSKASILHDLSFSKNVTFYTMLPASTETQWWFKNCRFADVVFVQGRIEVKGYVQPVSRAVVVFSPYMHKIAPTISYLEL